MKITSEDLLSKKEWIHSELLESIDFNKVEISNVYDVKLLVNGVEFEPNLFNNIMNNIEKHIISEARSLIVEKFPSINEKTRVLHELIDAAKNSIINEFDIDENDF